MLNLDECSSCVIIGYQGKTLVWHQSKVCDVVSIILIYSPSRSTYLVSSALKPTQHQTGATRHVQGKLLGPFPKLYPDRRLLLPEEIFRTERKQYRRLILLRVENHVTSLIRVLKGNRISKYL